MYASRLLPIPRFQFVIVGDWAHDTAGISHCHNIGRYILDHYRAAADDNFEVEGRLNYNPNAAGAILQMENDDYFGSDFAKIHQVIDMLFSQGYLSVKCADFVRASNLVNDFDDGNWETAYEDWQPQADKLKYINICFAIHSLNAYHPYSIPDILRMRKFGLMINIRHRMPIISL